jgi:hypothetical protein
LFPDEDDKTANRSGNHFDSYLLAVKSNFSSSFQTGRSRERFYALNVSANKPHRFRAFSQWQRALLKDSERLADLIHALVSDYKNNKTIHVLL